MRIFNPKRTQELQLENLDLDNGRLVSSTMKTTNEAGESVTERIFIYQSNEYVRRVTEIVAEMRSIKRSLNATDYLAIKFFEGELSTHEYEEAKQRRKAWRARYNELEAEKNALEM